MRPARLEEDRVHEARIEALMNDNATTKMIRMDLTLEECTRAQILHDPGCSILKPGIHGCDCDPRILVR